MKETNAIKFRHNSKDVHCWKQLNGHVSVEWELLIALWDCGRKT